ncbi:MAG: hypothetical protein WDZ53_04780 [Balneolales bacterium]
MRYLKNVLWINAISSGATALILIIFPGYVADLFGTSQITPFIGAGVFLLFFAIYVFLQSRKEPILPRNLQLIIGLDISWVLGSLIIIVPRLFELSQIGYLLIGAVALWVAAMAWLQFKGLNQLHVQIK